MFCGCAHWSLFGTMVSDYWRTGVCNCDRHDLNIDDEGSNKISLRNHVYI